MDPFQLQYQEFLRNFHLQFGFLKPPSFEEWKYNMGPQNSQQTHQVNFVNVPSTMVFPAQSCSKKFPQTQTTVDTNLTRNQSSSKRPIWGKDETEILLNAWKDNFSDLETVNKSLAWARIYSAVQTVSDRSLDACRKKVQNAKDNYNRAKKLNEDSGQILHKPEGYDIFDEIYGSRDVVTTPYFKDIYADKGAKNPTSTAASSTIAGATVPTPTRSQVEEMFKAGKKRPSEDKGTDKFSKLKKMFDEQEIKHQQFLTTMMDKRRKLKRKETF